MDLVCISLVYRLISKPLKQNELISPHMTSMIMIMITG
ncbi:hypothetical protein EJK54_1855 [Moraxella catarrhalis]|uniref:Uncharacterized protein n=1 Tax=Moraxella catarrhalis TaxID=480 RepID=A0ABY0BLD3_MORCA|nr:hypothetical protein EJK54_1855 [Moraxella catarrhalis]